MESVLMFLFLGEASQFKDIKEFSQSKQGSQDLNSESLNSNPMPAPLSQHLCLQFS